MPLWHLHICYYSSIPFRSFKFFIDVQLTQSIALIFGVHQSDTVIHIYIYVYIYVHFQTLFHYGFL